MRLIEFCRQFHEPLGLTQDEWMSVLDLSHMWAFTTLREHAIKQLDTSKLTATRRIQLSRKYDIPGWIPAAYTELVDRKERLKDEEVKELGLETAFEISRYREQRLEQLVTHFKSEHVSKRVCNSVDHERGFSCSSKKPFSWCSISLEVEDGCEIFHIPGTPSRKKPGLSWFQ